MSKGRDSMLQTIRQAVTAGNLGAPPPPHPERAGVGWQGAGGDVVERFCQECAAAGGQAHCVPDAATAADLVLSLLRTKAAQRVLLGPGVLTAVNFEEALQRTGIDIVHAGVGDKSEFFAADVGISGVDALIAETGSIVLCTRPEQPRSLSLLPPVHIALARREQILADLFDLFEDTLPGPTALPACVSIITGPSKTGDIELKLVTGVHGPGEVHVVIY